LKKKIQEKQMSSKKQKEIPENDMKSWEIKNKEKVKRYAIERRKVFGDNEALLMRIAIATERIAEAAYDSRSELAQLRQYKEEVQDEADHWIGQVETLFIESAETEHLDTDEALRLLRETQTFLMEKVNEGKSGV
jgi:hypothetical protein